MKMLIKNLNRLFAFTALILILSGICSAQIKKSKRPRWNWQKHQSQVIDYAKKYLVSDIEPNVPQISFEKWFGETVGRDAKINWDINDCGEQTGDPTVDKGRDFPMCVEADAVTPNSIYIRLNIQFGSFGRGILKMKPVVRSLTAGDEIGGNWLDNLSDLPKYLGGINQKSEYLNPTGGVFKLFGKQPVGFESIDGLLVRTMDYNGQEKNTYIESNGGIQVGQIYYEFSGFILADENLHFETMKINGVSFDFLGKLAKGHFDYEDLKREKALTGRLIKLVNDVKTAEADLSFDFVTNKKPDVPDQSMKISEIKKLNPPAGSFTTRGFVVINRACPPCPPGSSCKPCVNRILISEDNKQLDTYQVIEKEMTIAAENPQKFVKGQEYIFKIRIIQSKSTGDSLNDAHLTNFKVIN